MMQGPVIGLHGRRRAAQDDGAAVIRGPLAGDGDGMIARRLVLLVRAVVGFVDDEQTDGLSRREDRR